MVSRRSFLVTASSALASTVAARASRSSGTRLPSLAAAGDVTSLSVLELADAIQQRRLSSREIVLAFLDRIQAVNDSLNAVVQLRADSVLGEADVADKEVAQGTLRGPLHGVPMTIKDSFDTAGIVSTAGTPGRADHGRLRWCVGFGDTFAVQPLNSTLEGRANLFFGEDCCFNPPPL